MGSDGFHTKATKTTKFTRQIYFFVIVVSFVIFVCAPWALQPSDVEWTAHGGDGNIRYSPLAQVDRSNVAQLKVA